VVCQFQFIVQNGFRGLRWGDPSQELGGEVKRKSKEKRKEVPPKPKIPLNFKALAWVNFT
jgi:hypothetical protein